MLSRHEGLVGGGEASPAVLTREPLDHFLVEASEPHGVHAIVEKRLPRERKEWLHDLLADRCGVVPNLLLGVGIHPQGQEVQEVVQVHLPVGFGVGGEGQVLASLLSRHARLETLLVDRTGTVVQVGLCMREGAAGVPR